MEEESRHVEKAFISMPGNEREFIKLGNIAEKETKIFLGGTYGSSSWRDKLIPQLVLPYFNPVVPDWDEFAQAEEVRQKELCNIHLYVITPEMTGSYSFAEVIDSCHTKGVMTVLLIENSLRWKEFNGADVTHSLNATKDLAVRLGAVVGSTMDNIVTYLNSESVLMDLTYKLAPVVEFTIQSDPVSEVGVNGIQVDGVIRYGRELLSSLNSKIPSPQNKEALLKLMEALHWLEARTNDRVKRGVEGHNLA